MFVSLIFLRLGGRIIVINYRDLDGDVNMSSPWECSRNDVTEGLVVIEATVAVWAFQAGWPDLVAAAALLAVFLRSSFRVIRGARREIQLA